MPALTTERRPAVPVPPAPGGGAEHPRRGAPAPAGQGWSVRHRRQLAVSDALVVLWAVAGAHVIRFQGDRAALDIGTFTSSYLALSVVLAVAWWVALALTASRDARIVGVGAEEFRRVLGTSLRLFGSIAVVAFVVQADLARGYLAVAFPLGTLGLLLTRWMWRRLLHRQREDGLSSETSSWWAPPSRRSTWCRRCGAGRTRGCGGRCLPVRRRPAGPPPVRGAGARRAARGRGRGRPGRGHDRRGHRLGRRGPGRPAAHRLGARGPGPGPRRRALPDRRRRVPRPHPAGGRAAAPARRGAAVRGRHRAAKRAFDVVGAAAALLVLAPVLVAGRRGGPAGQSRARSSSVRSGSASRGGRSRC